MHAVTFANLGAEVPLFSGHLSFDIGAGTTYRCAKMDQRCMFQHLHATKSNHNLTITPLLSPRQAFCRSFCASRLISQSVNISTFAFLMQQINLSQWH
jgi:hypothetical protein